MPVLQWSQPDRHFIGLCTNCIEDVALQPVVIEIIELIGEIYSYDPLSGKDLSDLNSYSASVPVLHSVIHFEGLEILDNTTVISAELDMESGGSSQSAETTEVFTIQVQATTDAEDPANIADYPLFLWGSKPDVQTVNIGSPDNRLITFSAIKSLSQRVGSRIIGPANIAIDSAIGHAQTDYELYWDLATLRVSYYV